MPRCGIRAWALLASLVLWCIWWTPLEHVPQQTPLLILVMIALLRCSTSKLPFSTCLSKELYRIPFIFIRDFRRDSYVVSKVHEVIANSTYSCAEDGTEIYNINGCRIVQGVDGHVKVTHQQNKGLIRISPSKGSVTLTTSGIHCTASLGKTSHLFLRWAFTPSSFKIWN